MTEPPVLVHRAPPIVTLTLNRPPKVQQNPAAGPVHARTLIGSGTSTRRIDTDGKSRLAGACGPAVESGKRFRWHTARGRLRFQDANGGRLRPGPLISLLSVCVAVHACGRDPVRGCDPCRTTAIVYGTVLDSLGQAVAGVPVEVLAHVGGCNTPFRGFMNTPANSAGRYRALAHSLHSPFIADCFVVTANVEGDPRWPRVRTEMSGRVEFRAELDGVRRDSIRLDLIVGSQ